jgi:peptide deformylase
MVREILVWPHPTLKEKALPVTKFDAGLKQLIQDLFASMYAADGVGLAATQIGELKRVIVLDTTPKQPESSPLAMVNPQILSVEGETIYKEGCLSVPGEAEEVERALKVVVKFQDESGASHTMETGGLLAIAVQHETDHLNGVMFVDHISTLKRELIRKRMKKLKTSLAEDAAEEADSKKKTPAKAKRSEVR